MRTLFSVIALLAAIALSPSPAQANIFGLFGFDCCGGHNCGCGRQGCGGCCEPACGCNDCCEPACGCGGCCEPACGCGTGCFPNGRQYAGQTFDCCCETRTPICPCVGSCGGCCQPSCGCGDCCEPTCGEPACGCSSCCSPCGGCGTGCATWCGSGTANCPRKCCLKNWGFCSPCGHIVDAICKCTPCSGCSGEVYWSEWHNDPPCCQDPCNQCGQWTGGGCGSCGGGSCGCNSGSCGCGGGSTSSCGCDGGYASQTPPRSSTAFARHAPANRTIAANSRPQQQQQSAGQSRQSYVSQTPTQSVPMRTASRPMANRPVSNNQSQGNTQARPIMW